MKTNEKKNTSAKKKLIPAVAMLTTSAVMLSTATYAWFTLNREVEVKGLQMSATASNSLEISLGDLSTGEGAATITNPADGSATWSRVITVGEYYNSVGKLKPASSANGLNLFKIDDESNIYAGGTKVKDDATVVAVENKNTATLTPGKATDVEKLTQIEPENKDKGYFIDVPMWIRTSAKEESEVYCTVTITDGNSATDVAGDELMKAVRVAIIPKEDGDTAKVLSGSSSLTTGALDATVEAGESVNIFGLDSKTYDADSKVLAGAADTYEQASKSAPTIVKANGDADKAITAANTAVFTLPAADADSGKYGVEGFIVRVWLEGESQSCYDLTASQDWNINFNFSLDKRTGV
ncbi:hypothetical protein [uncultured Ruminococcus sp.]|uniref:hypothetical protein n=1 Tax=uncultured Ruminococcus sp. TaxID=165186 RepID=UPI0026174EE8|nr:hypothetical protein [uncultured Ruminococcus sp.]